MCYNMDLIGIVSNFLKISLLILQSNAKDYYYLTIYKNKHFYLRRKK